MARPRKFKSRVKMQEYLSKYDLEYFMSGFCFNIFKYDSKDEYREKMRKAWAMYKDDIMDWWHSDKSYNDLAPEINDEEEYTKAERLGKRPRIWWEEDAPEKWRRRLGGYARSLGGGWYGVPSSYGGIDLANPPCFESQAAYLRRHGLLTEEEEKMEFCPYEFLDRPHTKEYAQHIKDHWYKKFEGEVFADPEAKYREYLAKQEKFRKNQQRE
jgi:hypothetical protein